MTVIGVHRIVQQCVNEMCCWNLIFEDILVLLLLGSIKPKPMQKYFNRIRITFLGKIVLIVLFRDGY